MTRKVNYLLGSAISVLLLFVLWTVLVLTVDRAPIGPSESIVGLAAFNRTVYDLLCPHTGWHLLSEVLGLLPLATAGGFALLGAWQLIRRRSLRAVDPHLYLLAALYLAVAACYLGFELWIINYRPVLTDGLLEASYPSSHTMLAICILGSAAVRFTARADKLILRRIAAGAAVLTAVLIVVGRLLSGVHWPSDIIGGILLGVALTLFDCAADRAIDNARR